MIAHTLDNIWILINISIYTNILMGTIFTLIIITSWRNK